jgi:hypothetical protein
MGSRFECLQAPANFKELFGSLPELRNPRKDEDIRIHGDWLLARVPVVRVSTNSFFLVDPKVYGTLVGRMMICDLRAVIAGDAGMFVWPVRMDLDSAVEAAEAAKAAWIKVIWETSNRKYKIEPAAKEHGEPAWPFGSFDQLLDVVLKDRVLSDPEHEVVKAIVERKKKGA